MGRRKKEVLVDFYSREYVRVWLAYDYDNGFDEVGETDIGSRPEWLQWELENMSWADILSVRGRYTAADEDGNSFDDSMLIWGLHEGIAPGQPFLLWMEHPHYYTSNTENGVEHDVDYSWEIERVFPWPLKKVATLFEGWRDGVMKYREAERLRRRKEKHVQRTDVKSMFLDFEPYFSNGSWADDMASPTGIRYSLRTTATLAKKKPGWATATLASGEDADGDHEKALQCLIEQAVKALPGLSPEAVRSLPKRSSRW